MTALPNIDNPEAASLAIRFPNVFQNGKPLCFRNFSSYEYHEHFLRESDGWSFELPQDILSQVDLTAIVPRVRVEVSIDDVVQSIGILDDVRAKSDRNGGTVYTLRGRDWLSPAVDCHVDPNLRFKPGMSVLDVVSTALAPFGIRAFATDNDANRNAITGETRTPTTKTGKPLNSFLVHELKPYQQESVFKFASRTCQRNGLWLWAGQDGETVIVGKPDFTQAARYQLRNLRSDPRQNNVIDADVTISGKDQPSCILACGFGGGGEFAKSTLRSGIINPIVNADLSAVTAAYPSVRFATIPFTVDIDQAFDDPSPRPLFLYDSESHTQAELDKFVLREMSLLLRKSLSAHYTIEGHQLGGVNLAVDTIVDVWDERSNLQTTLWVIGRSFTKRRNEGTRSTLECIRPGSLQL
jgi:prophage tail gpP-like protein